MKLIIKSIVLGTIITWIFLYVFSMVINGGDVVGIIGTMTITSTIIFCTYTIINEIRKLKD
ncbi:MAG: hypothetical protein E6940_03350 [Clostridium septicum]|uniref:hypothetical protein n=1 Tax=Clostridium septicum TaxID=1504 RepID=UPI00258EF2FB|nr:hypothetical protein [Clostridium septicum]MDU1313079.1 hypothetical protein [Clostridium septicum]